MKRRTKVVFFLVIGIGVASVAAKAMRPDGKEETETETFTVTMGTVVEKAMASGTIEPSTEVEVKSKVSGVVRQIYMEAGQFVEAGTPLVEIRPDPTPLELVDARRQLEVRQLELQTAIRERDRQRALQQTGAVTGLEVERADRHAEEVTLQVTIAREKLALLEGGRVTVGDRPLESVITAPISGFILERIVQVGEMVSPLSSFQPGTVLFKMANMSDLVFRGTVDEIDVGRLQTGAEVSILIGALPDVKMSGRLTRISLRSKRDAQSIGFPVEIAITDLNGAVLRAGYSASAEITVQRADKALLIPERLIEWKGDTATVTIQKNGGATERRVIKTGVSDAVNVQVISGLAAGDKVIDRNPKRPETTTGNID